jgi:hypothetical protein
MDERSGTVRLVESGRDVEARSLVATVSRADVEGALGADEGPVDLVLDVERAAATGDGRETQRIALAWEPQDLERLLAITSDDEVSLTFDEDELQRLLDEDVEAHGARQKLATLTVAAGMAAAGAGSAFAMPAPDSGSPGGTAIAAAATQAQASEVSTGLGGAQAAPTGAQAGRTAAPSEISTGITGAPPAAAPSEISTGIVQQPPRPPAEVTTGITAEPTSTPVSADQPSWAPSATEGAVAAGMILALTAVGFMVRSRRARPAI